MLKSTFSALAVLALATGGTVMSAHAQDAPKPQAEKKEETPEQAKKRKKALLDAERERVRPLLPFDGDIVPKPEDTIPRPDLDMGVEGANIVLEPFRRSSDTLIADLIKPYDECQKKPDSEEVNSEYEKAYKALQEKIDYLKKELGEGVEKRLRGDDIERLKKDLQRLEDFRDAMPKPGECHGYHGK